MSNVTARPRVTHCPSPEGLLLQVGNLGGEVRDGHRDVPWGRRGELHLHNKTENVSPHVGVSHLGVSPEGVQLGHRHLLGSGQQGRGFLDQSGHRGISDKISYLKFCEMRNCKRMLTTGRLQEMLAGRGRTVPGLAQPLVWELGQGEAGVTVDVRVPGAWTEVRGQRSA